MGNTVGNANDPIVQQTAANAGIDLFNLPGEFGIGCTAIVVFSNPWYGLAITPAATVYVTVILLCSPNTVNGPDIFAVNCDINDLGAFLRLVPRIPE